ncbi:signal transduction histidine kinase [Variovorax boronicumulans]|uniref:histidine kinase n=1 Tax=Variovorax boronicumulans TaxID=436515 RepID=A0AAW8E0A3_9BURK|nr:MULTISPECIES: HAMP domain-containing sensor histidine kinase [Variovorax]MDP9880226.1 signal transduction histidine kinase [Variovorax boronicumulans]MDP9919610.1 signal transduction histidine kinase [Variovorax boronicumulans]MDP9925511.1 signal transduction histidine kinase [Variovorax boronicumulans]TSD55970.1 HAMP domain-containing histidine kinase [Variovorax sp. KBS0712]
MSLSLLSLRWRLIWSLILLQVVVGLLVMGGFLGLAWALGRVVDETGHETVAAIQRALMRGADGQLVVEPTSALRRLQKADPQFWFIVRDPRGVQLRHGEVPPAYLRLLDALDDTERVAIDPESDGTRPKARFERIESRAGPVAVMAQTGGPLTVENTLKGTGIAFLFLVAPMALVTCLGVILATPFVVKRGLKGVVATAEHAEGIDVHERTTRLPLANVASEIRPLVNAVNRAFDRLNEGYDRQERFLADAAHELRTPITTLQIHLEGLPNDPLKMKLMQASARLATLAEQLLDLQRLDHGLSLDQQVELKSLCERVAADIAPLAIRSRCTLSVDAPQPLTVRGDAPSLERALTNLIQNAIEHGGPGCDIQVRLCEPSCIEVRDSGPGIPEADRERVVAPFHRLVPRGRGAGLGLHLVAEVARLHRGQLSIGSSESGGAKMRLELMNLEA